MSILDTAKKYFKKDAPKGEDKTPYTKIDSIEQAANYLAAIKDKQEAGDYEIDVRINTATEMERREYLNYCINLIPDKYIKHKILLFLRCNPFHENAQTGRGLYLSTKEIARVLTKKCGFKVFECEVEAIEREGLEICKQTLRSSREEGIPLVGTHKF